MGKVQESVRVPEGDFLQPGAIRFDEGRVLEVEIFRQVAKVVQRLKAGSYKLEPFETNFLRKRNCM